MLNFLINNWIALASLAVAVSGFIFTIWMNHINVMATFKWVKSTNDDSSKLLITITNLSPRTTVLTGLTLKHGKRIIGDNGYDYEETEQKIEDEERSKKSAEHEARIKEIENMTVTPDPEHSDFKLPKSMLEMNKKALIAQENSKYYHDDLIKAINMPQEKTLRKSTNKSESNNFEDAKTLFGNDQIKFSYWLGEESPDTMKLIFSSLITPFHRTKSFTIPVNQKNVQKNSDVK